MKTLRQKMEEVAEFCVAKGWSGPGSPVKNFDDCIALLHSEVSEALEAYRDHGLEDATQNLGQHQIEGTLPKPEGVGSELADVLIRLLDDMDRFSINPGQVYNFAGVWRPSQACLKNDTFGSYIRFLHEDIARVGFPSARAFGYVLGNLRYFAKRYGVDLEFEYERKMAYNWTRTFRHGGKRL